ncbi:hypothetical protein HPB47_005990 [Ixodes persulcatus]|uniref:Uncharacterized protein n=1 Tax=Ixodes persulcatus TaxID=34615 RepID=A0AC60PBN0_IXOPE|nr:hypothetical protein HPB47_005990 [Ixodes persulcatus]
MTQIRRFFRKFGVKLYFKRLHAYSQDKAEMATPGDTMAPGSSVGNVNAPATRATGSKGKAFTKWKPRPMPKPDPEDYVIVIKPRERVSLHEVLTETGYGTAISAYLGPERARAISVLPSRDQNIVIVHTPDIEAADRLIGDFAVNTEKDSIPLQGYLRQDGGNTCHGVIVVRNTDTTETLQHRVCGAPVPLWKSENSAHPTRHASPSRPNTCGLCGLQAPLVEGVRAPHNCVPRCSVCGGAHATNSRDCAAKFRTPKMAAQTGGKKNMAPKKKSRHLGPPGDQSRRETSRMDGWMDDG